MHILVTNDDGAFAPGIYALVLALQTIAEVTVIAPDQNRSGISSALSLETPLRIMKTPAGASGWWQMNGTPADCVRLALSGFLEHLPDMVVSGINAGDNMGDNVIYSGTVGGATEGRFLKYPPIAISAAGRGHDQMYYETAGQVAIDLIKRLRKSPIESGVILNVNVPSVPYTKLQGMKITRLGDRHFGEPIIPAEDGRGRRIYWIGDTGKVKDDREGTDFHAVHNDYVSITPLQIDLTSHRHLDPLGNWLT
jgi:5'-nucleotidase